MRSMVEGAAAYSVRVAAPSTVLRTVPLPRDARGRGFADCEVRTQPRHRPARPAPRSPRPARPTAPACTPFPAPPPAPRDRRRPPSRVPSSRRGPAVDRQPARAVQDERQVRRRVDPSGDRIAHLDGGAAFDVGGVFVPGHRGQHAPFSRRRQWSAGPACTRRAIDSIDAPGDLRLSSVARILNENRPFWGESGRICPQETPRPL